MKHKDDQRIYPTRRLRQTIWQIFCMGVMLILFASCSTMKEDDGSAANDPYEEINRKVFAVNLKIDDVLLEPTAKGYRRLPESLQVAVSNHLEWTGMPSIALNSTFQGKMENAALSVFTFAINGLTLGLFDLTEGEDRPEREDFGQTLASAGVIEGPYLMMPFLGSHTGRSLIGRAVDTVTNPMGQFEAIASGTVRTATAPISAISIRAKYFKLINDAKNNSLDPYAATRSGYYQRRRALLRDNIDDEGEDDDSDFDSFFSE